QGYVKWQGERPDAIVPATRIGFILPAAILAKWAGLNSLAALHWVSVLASILLLLAVPVIAVRMEQDRDEIREACRFPYGHAITARVLVLTALIAVAPLQVHLAQRAL